MTSQNQNGDSWDVQRQRDQEQLSQVCDRERPALLIGSMPFLGGARALPELLCAAGRLAVTRPEVAYDSGMESQSSVSDARNTSKFLAKLYSKQLKAGNHFVHEQPSEENAPEIADLARGDRIFVVDGPECKIESSTCKDGSYIRRKTKWITSSEPIAESLRHFAVSAKAQRRQIKHCGSTTVLQYPTVLMKELFKACKQEFQEQGHAQGMCSYDAGPIPDEDDRAFMRR